MISAISTAVLMVLIIGVAWTLWVGLRRARPPGRRPPDGGRVRRDHRLPARGGKVLSPQFMVWLLPVGFLVAGRYGPAAFGLTIAALLTTLAYFPHSYWDLVALHAGPIAILVLRERPADRPPRGLLAAARASPASPSGGC